MTAMSSIECVQEQVRLADRTWFKLGGPAQYFAEPSSVEEMQAVVERCRDEGLHVRLLGGGSNVLVRDSNDAASPAFLRSSSFGRPVTTAGGVFGSGGPRAFQFAARVTF